MMASLAGSEGTGTVFLSRQLRSNPPMVTVSGHTLWDGAENPGKGKIGV